MTDFFAKILKLSVVVPKGAINTDLFKLHKVDCGDPIESLVSIGDFVTKFDVDITIKLCILHVKVDDLQVHVHVRDNCTQLDFVFQVLDSDRDRLAPFLEQVLDVGREVIIKGVRWMRCDGEEAPRTSPKAK